MKNIDFPFHFTAPAGDVLKTKGEIKFKNMKHKK